jgi:TolA-binding protein
MTYHTKAREFLFFTLSVLLILFFTRNLTVYADEGEIIAAKNRSTPDRKDDFDQFPLSSLYDPLLILFLSEGISQLNNSIGTLAKVDTTTPIPFKGNHLSEAEQQNQAEKKIYVNALKAYQSKNYPEAISLFKKIIQAGKKNPYASSASFLSAEAEYQITFLQPEPNYEKALLEYTRLIMRYPESEYFDAALYKIAIIYGEMGRVQESLHLHKKGLEGITRSIYNDSRKLESANLLMAAKRYDEAAAAFNQVSVDTIGYYREARQGLLTIAKHYYNQNNFHMALKTYEELEKRWAANLWEWPEVHFNMGEIYYKQNQFKKARSHFFDLINIDPDLPMLHKALQRIGDSFLLEGKTEEARNIFTELAERKKTSP